MLAILLTMLASALGTFLGNLTLFWVIGSMAKRQERENQEKLQSLQRGYLEMVQRENERMRNYAKMES